MVCRVCMGSKALKAPTAHVQAAYSHSLGSSSLLSLLLFAERNGDSLLPVLHHWSGLGPAVKITLLEFVHNFLHLGLFRSSLFHGVASPRSLWSSVSITALRKIMIRMKRRWIVMIKGLSSSSLKYSSPRTRPVMNSNLITNGTGQIPQMPPLQTSAFSSKVTPLCCFASS